MVRKRAWILNLEADEELARPAGYTPKAAAVARARALATHLAALLGPEDVLVWPDDPAALPYAGAEGRAWCPTPRALRALRRAGAEPAPAPPLAVLRRVNHRRFCAELGQPLPGARFVETLAELTETIAGPSPTGQWILKRPFAFSGRGRMRVAQGALDPAALPWIAASLSGDTGAPEGASPGLQVEPWVERSGDFSVHGHLTQAGALVLGAPCAQRCDERGAWQETRRAEPGELTPAEARALLDAARAAAEALTAAGYFGPFGVDAFRWIDAGASARFNPRCEINARYTMGWAIGMGPCRPDLGYAGPTR